MNHFLEKILLNVNSINITNSSKTFFVDNVYKVVYDPYKRHKTIFNYITAFDDKGNEYYTQESKLQYLQDWETWSREWRDIDFNEYLYVKIITRIYQEYNPKFNLQFEIMHDFSTQLSKGKTLVLENDCECRQMLEAQKASKSINDYTDELRKIKENTNIALKSMRDQLKVVDKDIQDFVNDYPFLGNTLVDQLEYLVNFLKKYYPNNNTKTDKSTKDAINIITDYMQVRKELDIEILHIKEELTQLNYIPSLINENIQNNKDLIEFNEILEVCKELYVNVVNVKIGVLIIFVLLCAVIIRNKYKK